MGFNSGFKGLSTFTPIDQQEWTRAENNGHKLACSIVIQILHDYWHDQLKSRRMRWARHVGCMGEGRGVYWVLVGKPEGKRPLGRPRRRWKNNIKIDHQEVGCGGMD